MNKIKLVALSLFGASSLFAVDALVDAATKAGLKPIPSEHKAQMKLIKEFQKGITVEKAVSSLVIHVII
jgi:hypothetical protein